MPSLLARRDPFARIRDADDRLGSLDVGDAERKVVDLSGREVLEVELIAAADAAISSREVLVTLLPDPFHRLGADTIGVELDGHLVGRLSPRDAEKHAPRLHDLMWQDVTIRCKAATIGGALVLFMRTAADHEPASEQPSPAVPHREPSQIAEPQVAGRLLLDGERIDVSSGRIEVMSCAADTLAKAASIVRNVRR